MPVSSPAPVVAALFPNPHVFSRQLIGLLLWVGPISALAGIYTFVVCVSLALLTFADAWKSGIYVRREKRGFLNISPMAWGIAMAFLFVVAFPVYLLRRSELRTIHATNRYFWGLVFTGAALIVAFVGNLVLWM